jgi:membrane fusion protein, multidrug efflux system
MTTLLKMLNLHTLQLPHPLKTIRSKKMKKTIIAIVLFSIFLLACSSQQQETSITRKIPVKLVNIMQQDLSIPIQTSGILQAKDELYLSFKTGGIIKNIYVKEGQIVKKDQVLARLDLAEISAYKNQAQAAYEKAQRDFTRIENLYQEQVATLEQKQNMHSALEVAKANLDIASFNKKHSTISAPANGKILKTFVDEAELIGAGTPVLTFGSTDKAYVLKAGITDKDVVIIQKGDAAEITFDAYPQSQFTAIVTEISGAATPGSGTYEVQLQLEKSDKTLFSGFVGKATIHPQRKQTVSLIPLNALNEATQNSGYVYTVNENNQATKKEIRIAFILDNQVAFYNDLQVNRIVNQGNAYLFEKSPVEVIN